MSKIPQREVWKEVGVQVDGQQQEHASMLAFAIRRNWPKPTDETTAVLAKWSSIVATIIREPRGVDDRSLRAAVLAYELDLTVRLFADASAEAAIAMIEPEHRVPEN